MNRRTSQKDMPIDEEEDSLTSTPGHFLMAILMKEILIIQITYLDASPHYFHTAKESLKLISQSK